MIVCTGCGARNQDAAQACEKCGRKLQSRWAAPPAPPEAASGGAGGPVTLSGGAAAGSQVPGGLNGSAQNFAPGGPDRSSSSDGPWQPLPTISPSFDESAGKMVRSAAEVWSYAFILLAGAAFMLHFEDWRYLAGSIAVTAGLAWARGI